MHVVAHRLKLALDRLPLAGPRRYCVALSGGLDSTALLLLLQETGCAGRAIHVDHGLVVDSSSWADHCRRICADRDMELLCLTVQVAQDGGQGLEAAAREARYQAFAEVLMQGEVLLTAHHAQDQLETLLLRLMRGTGVTGLGGIRPWRPLGRGFLARPLLNTTKEDLRTYLESQSVPWIEDPSNTQQHLDRNFLRAQVVPKLLERWPGATNTTGRTADLMADAGQLLDDLARQDQAAVADSGAGMPLAPLRRLSPARQRNLLRWAIQQAGLPVPSHMQLETLRATLEPLDPGAMPLVAWPGGEARVYRQRLYLMTPLTVIDSVTDVRLEHGGTYHGRLGSLQIAPGSVPGWSQDFVSGGFEIRTRRGGERFRPRPEGPRRSLKNWFQEQAVLPWMRDRIPLLYRGDQLVAIGDLWQTPQTDSNGDWRVRWWDHPATQG